MSGDFAREWHRERAGVTDQHAAMRLNSAPTEPFAPGGSGGFASTPAEKQTAANTIESELQPRTKKATEHADEATNTAQKGFEGWDTAGALKKVSDTWDQQARNLMGRLSGEKTALRGASGLFVRNDTGLENQFLVSGSKLNGL
ncbi:hypothetical protein [Streptomyces sp. H34-S4]|uniref:hypothetical protein n=1 Tax=Streptomyces sp. H34-S4 TaxID=2996463 RepID=UPI0022719B9E|nr:hypothetical protein [Streptomyces sp. H34-S4]MCY0938985.1 hypothetical protein [Streptomyces sp. H34-S4]